ncbi:Kunitz family serine protease inhibitor, partial [Arthrobacter sp. E3]|uniref:Kunitz family serine protease inhibitor n=1 Tax=Arthrobacter sp. E3 TaxID=517402 RepID=UPI001A946EB8
VVDTNGDKIHTGSIHDVTYRIRPGPGIGFRGGLGRSPIKGDKCQKYIYEGPETFPGEPIQFDTDFDSGSDVMEVGLRYRFTFLSSQQKTCKKPGVWTIG